MRRAHWDDEREVWVLERLSDIGKRDLPLAKRPVSASGQRRPVSDFAKLASAMGDMNPRCDCDCVCVCVPSAASPACGFCNAPGSRGHMYAAVLPLMRVYMDGVCACVRAGLHAPPGQSSFLVRDTSD
jgi:hypothetical protein